MVIIRHVLIVMELNTFQKNVCWVIKMLSNKKASAGFDNNLFSLNNFKKDKVIHEYKNLVMYNDWRFLWIA